MFDPKAFTDDFEDRMSELIDYCRQLESVGIPCNVVNFAFTAIQLIQTNNVFKKRILNNCTIEAEDFFETCSFVGGGTR